MARIIKKNPYDGLLFDTGLIQKVFLCASIIMTHAQNGRLAEILSRKDDGYPKRIIDDTDYLMHEVVGSLTQHAKYMGSRICQDWSGSKENSPEFLFSPQEREILSRVYEQYNSNMQDFEPNFDSFGDEMVISHVIATAIRVIGLYNRRTTTITLSLRDAIDFAVDMLPDAIDVESDLFNFAINQIQNTLGQDSGDNAGMFFSDEGFFDCWKEGDKDYRKELLMEYVRHELSHMGD